MYKWKKGDDKTMAALVVACVIGSVAGFGAYAIYRRLMIFLKELLNLH